MKARYDIVYQAGKGYTISRQLLIDAKIVDVDGMKDMFAKLSALGKGKFAEYTGNRKFDFKNSQDVSDLHAMIGDDLGLDHKMQSNLFHSMSSGGFQTNIIFDITGKTSTKLMNIANQWKRIGYKCSLVWVVTNRQVAMIRNLMRDRVVGERLFHEIHNQVRDTLLSFIKSNDAADYDEAWIIFSGSSEVSDLPKDVQDALFKDSVVKLEKKGSAFVLPKALEGRIINFLGAKEKNPANPTTYKKYDEVKGIIAPYKKTEVDKEGKTKVKLKGYKDLKLTNR